MILTSLGVNSKGNCHIVTDSLGNKVLLDCGVKFPKIAVAVGNFNQLSLVLYTHEHKDHSLSLKELSRAGIKCYGPMQKLEPKPYQVWPWKFVPIPVAHSVDCYAYILYNYIDNKTMLYVTDAIAMPRIAERQYDLMLLECNWTEKLIMENANDDVFSRSRYNDHMSSETLLEWMKSRSIMPSILVLTHMSDSNLDKASLLNEITPLAHHVLIAKPGGNICF